MTTKIKNMTTKIKNMTTKINLLDGGMIFELNKYYNDFGQSAVSVNEKLIKSIYQNYIDIGCSYLTTCNYGFTPRNVGNDWYKLTTKSIKIMEQFKSDDVKIMGCVPPYFKSYYQGDVDTGFVEFYSKLIDIFKEKIDYYLIETNINYKHADQIINFNDEEDAIVLNGKHYGNNFSFSRRMAHRCLLLAHPRQWGERVGTNQCNVSSAR